MTQLLDFLQSVKQDKHSVCFLNGICQSQLVDAVRFNPEIGEITVLEKASITMVMVYNDFDQNHIFTIDAQAKVNIVLIYANKVKNNIIIKQGGASQVNIFQISLSAESLKNNITVNLNAEFASFKINGIQFANAQQTLATSLVVFHRVPNTISEVNYKSIADQKAEIFISARINVSKNAIKIVSETNLNNLLMSNAATIDTMPELEIYADDVKCSHGATVGDLHEESLFYLLSRGIDQQQARSMLMQAFLQSLIDQLDPAIQLYVVDKIKHKLMVAEVVA